MIELNVKVAEELNHHFPYSFIYSSRFYFYIVCKTVKYTCWLSIHDKIIDGVVVVLSFSVGHLDCSINKSIGSVVHRYDGVDVRNTISFAICHENSCDIVYVYCGFFVFTSLKDPSRERKCQCSCVFVQFCFVSLRFRLFRDCKIHSIYVHMVNFTCWCFFWVFFSIFAVWMPLRMWLMAILSLGCMCMVDSQHTNIYQIAPEIVWRTWQEEEKNRNSHKMVKLI